MRVCHVIHDLRRGGAEHLLVDMAMAASSAGIEMSVVSLMPTDGHSHADAIRAAGVGLRSLGLAAKWDPRGGRRLAALLEELQPDLIHTHLKHADLVGAKAARKTGLPMVSSLHVIEDAVGIVGRVKRQLAMRARDRAAARIVAVSGAVREWYQSLSARDPDTVVVLRNGVRPHPSPRPNGRSDERARLGVPESSLLAVAAVVLRPGKGIDDLLRVAASLPPEPDVRFVVAGSGPEESYLREEASRLGLLGGKVLFPGFVEDVPALLEAADLLVHPSHADALATAIIHGLAAGLPIVATEVGGTSEIVTPDVGVLVPPKSPAELGAAIGRLAADDEQRRRMGAAALRRFAAEFSIDVWAAQLAEIYEQVAAER